MSWLKKFFKPAEYDSESEYVKRAGRFSINILHNAKLHLQVPALGDNIEVQLKNISPAGIAFLLLQSSQWFSPGKKINAHIRLSQVSLPITLVVRHITGDQVGCQIDKGLKEYFELFQEYFLEESLASQIYPVDKEMLKDDEDGTPYYYMTDQNRSSLHYTLKDGNLVKFNLTILGNSIQMDAKEQVIFSFLMGQNDGNENEKIVVKIFEFPLEVATLALRFIQCAEVVPENIRMQIVASIKKHGQVKAA